MADSTHNTPPDPLLGRLVDHRYQIGDLLDSGGMATVYVAKDLRLDRPVAMKIIHPHLARSARFTERFEREARSAARVSHAGIVPVYDQGMIDGRAYLVMELISGQSLRRMLTTLGPLSVGQAFSFIEQILVAVGAAHAAGLVHRDLKPENVLVTAEGTLKLVDFGLARATTDDALTSASLLIGTAAYIAPEATLPGQVDHRGDLYSAGIVLFEMLVGELPWRSPSPAGVCSTTRDVPAPSAALSWMPTEVDHVVHSLCARDPKERPVSAEAALKLLAAARESLAPELLDRRADVPGRATASPTQTTSVTAPPSTDAWAENRARAFTQVIHTSGGPRTSAAPARRRARLPLVVAVALLILAGLAVGSWWWMRYGPGSYVTVPQVAGMSSASAAKLLEQQDITFMEDQVYSDDVSTGAVVGTDPATGSRVHRSETLTLLVSQGVEMVTVPDVSRLTQKQATDALAKVSLGRGELTEVWSSSVPAGEVVSSTPSGGQSVPHDTVVALKISKGPEPVSVPDVAGLDSDDAVKAITQARLIPEVSSVYSSDVPAGMVLSQSPAAGGTPLSVGDTVALVISRGSETTTVPEVIGLDATAAEKVLQDAGFDVKIRRGLGFFSTVFDQDPASGETAEVGSTVTITVR